MNKTFKLWAEKDIIFLKENYNLMSISEIALKMGRTEYSITKKASDLKMSHQPYNKKYMSEKSRKYTLEHSFFDSINTNDKAYFLGLLYADGYNCTDKNVLELSLQTRDKEILSLFKKCLASNRPIKRYVDKRPKRGTDRSILYVNSRRICQNLDSLGCTNKKSHKISFPTIKERFKKHFIRGFFDGDGSVYISKGKIINGYVKRSPTGHVAFSSNKKFIEGLFKQLKKFNPCKVRDKRKKDTWYLNITGIAAIQFLESIYFGTTTYIKRKYKKYQEVKKMYSSKKVKRRYYVNMLVSY